MNTYAFLSGLPRTGSTLLSSILSENPAIHAEGNSAVCQLMWDMQESCLGPAFEQISATSRQGTIADMVSAIPGIYYKDVENKLIIDKCRSWTIPANMALIRQFITAKPKVIVLIRPIDEIVKSFASLHIKNGKEFNFDHLLKDYSEPVMRSFAGVMEAKASGNDEFLFVSYADLTTDTRNTLKTVYDFLELPVFEHDLETIVNRHPENDEVYGLMGQHDVRSTIGVVETEIELPASAKAKCDYLNQLLFA